MTDRLLNLRLLHVHALTHERQLVAHSSLALLLYSTRMASLGAPTVVAFLAFVLVLFPLPWLLHSKNIATLSLVFWLAQANFFQIINTYVWSDNVIVRLERYCNICTSACFASITTESTISPSDVSSRPIDLAMLCRAPC